MLRDARCGARGHGRAGRGHDLRHGAHGAPQGDMVLAVSEGSFGGVPTSYYDLWRVEDGKIAEHWDVMETIAECDT